MKPHITTSEEPGISVNAPATRPPVQDSAVAIVSLRALQSSSSERAKALVSLALMMMSSSVLSQRQSYRGAGGSCNPFFAAGEAEALAGRRLDGDARHRHAGNVGDASAHRVAMRTYFGSLADQRHFEIGNAAAALADTAHGIFKKAVGGSAFPLRIGRRKMHADVAVGKSAEHGIDEGMQP